MSNYSVQLFSFLSSFVGKHLTPQRTSANGIASASSAKTRITIQSGVAEWRRTFCFVDISFKNKKQTKRLHTAPLWRKVSAGYTVRFGSNKVKYDFKFALWRLRSQNRMKTLFMGAAAEKSNVMTVFISISWRIDVGDTVWDRAEFLTLSEFYRQFLVTRLTGDNIWRVFFLYLSHRTIVAQPRQKYRNVSVIFVVIVHPGLPKNSSVFSRPERLWQHLA